MIQLKDRKTAADKELDNGIPTLVAASEGASVGEDDGRGRSIAVSRARDITMDIEPVARLKLDGLHLRQVQTLEIWPRPKKTRELSSEMIQAGVVRGRIVCGDDENGQALISIG